MKRIIEVKRGDPVPDNAKWLKDCQKVVKEWEEDNSPHLPPEQFQEWATFDVFEIQGDIGTKTVPTADGNTMHGMGFR